MKAYFCARCGESCGSSDIILGKMVKSFRVTYRHCPLCGGKMLLSGGSWVVEALVIIVLNAFLTNFETPTFGLMVGALFIGLGVIRLFKQARAKRASSLSESEGQ